MSIFGCSHYWEVVSTDYTPPVNMGKLGITKVGYDLAQMMLNGTTHVYQRCKYCGEVKQQDFLGKFTPGATP